MRHLNLPLDKKIAASLIAGEEVLLSGPVFTARDATHEKIAALLHETGELPFGLKDQIVMYAGPTPARGDRVLGSVGPTTAKRMDRLTPELLRAGLAGTFGKGNRTQEVVDAVRETESVYFGTIGGVAALLAKHVVTSEVIAYPELGPEALIRLELDKFPAFVALDSKGNDFYAQGPAAWRKQNATQNSTSSAQLNEPTQEAVERGRFITIEGGEGAGKSTQIVALARQLEMKGEEVLVLREPGDTKLGEHIREILLNKEDIEISPRAELLLYEAARAELVEAVIKPALAQGINVICDRFFDSTTAYQGYGRGIELTAIEQLNLFATNNLIPDRTILLITEAGAGLKRAQSVSAPDRLERAGLEFHTRVHAGFAEIATQNPERVRVVISDRAIVEVFFDIIAQVADLFPHLDLMSDNEDVS